MRDDRTKQIQPYMQYIMLILMLLFSWMLQSAPISFLTIYGIRPVLTIVFVAAVGVMYGEGTGGVFGLAAGLLMDIYTAPALSFHVVVLTALGIGCGLIVKHFLMYNFLSAVILCFISCLCYFFLYWLVFKVILGSGGVLYLYRFSLPAAFYTGLFGFLYCPVVRWIRKLGA